MYRLLKSVIILLSISFVFGQNWNTKGTVPMTFRVTVEPYMPPDEFMSIEFWKNGAVEENYPKKLFANGTVGLIRTIHT